MEGKKGDISDMVSYYVFASNTRMLDEAMRALIGKIDASKFKVDVLRQVFDAWRDEGGDLKGVDSVLFWYDERRWRGTIRREQSRYAGRLVSFINVKLPNDGYLYGPEYAEPQTRDDIVLTEETRSFVYHFQERLVAAFPDFLDDDVRIEVSYDPLAQRLALYFWNSTSDRCITVKFEYGFHEGTRAISKGKFNRIKESHS